MKKTPNKKKAIALIKKSNDLIESRYKFDIWETRFFLSVLARIHREDENFDVYRIKYRDIIKDFDLKSAQSYGLLREGARKLLKQTVLINYEKDGTVRTEELHLIKKIDYLADSKGKQNTDEHEYIDVTIEEELRPFLLQLSKNFTAYDLGNVAKLGAYSIRIYELLKQYESIGKRKIGVDEIRIMLQVMEEYPLFANFYQRIIAPAVKEINKHTDLRILKVEKLKDGKRVSDLEFKFIKKSTEETKKILGVEGQPKTLFEDSEESRFSIIQDAEVIEIVEEQSKGDKLYLQFEEIVVRNFGVTPSVFMQLGSHHTAEQIEQAIRVTRRAKANAQIKTNVPGYFVKALKEGYTDIKEEQEKKKEAEAEKQRKKIETEQVEAEQEKRINNKIREIIEENPNITEQAIELLKDDFVTKKRIDVKEKQLGRVLEIQDYREDKTLMNAVKLKILALEKGKSEGV